jgi:hypothetical protein
MWSTLAEEMGKNWGHMAASVGIRTPYAPRTQGGSYIGRGPLRLIKSFSHAVFCAVYYPQRVRPQPWVSQNDVS